MTEHLPECPLLEPCSADTPNHGFCSRQNTICIHCERQCICSRLRACEERCDEKRHAEVRAWSELSRDNFDHGFAAGLDAAREAVVASWKGWCDDPTTCTDYEHVCGERRNTLAAIDALRKDGND